MYRGEGGFYGLLMQETGNRDQGAGNPSRFAPGAGRKQGTGSREQGAGKREPQSLCSRGRQETGIRKLGTGKYTEGQDSSLRSE